MYTYVGALKEETVVQGGLKAWNAAPTARVQMYNVRVFLDPEDTSLKLKACSVAFAAKTMNTTL